MLALVVLILFNQNLHSFCISYFLRIPLGEGGTKGGLMNPPSRILWTPPFKKGELALNKVSEIYRISDPFLTALSGETIDNVPSAFSAHRIIPCDSIPRSFFGARFTKIETCVPINSSGL